MTLFFAWVAGLLSGVAYAALVAARRERRWWLACRQYKVVAEERKKLADMALRELEKTTEWLTKYVQSIGAIETPKLGPRRLP